MKFSLLAVVILLLSSMCVSAQPPAAAPDQIVLKKQILADDTETRLKDIPYAAVRVYIRYRVADWLWKQGADPSGRAEGIAVRAVNEIYANSAEIPDAFRYKLAADLFALLDKNAKEAGAKLKTIHKFGQEDDLQSSFNQMLTPGGDQIVGPKVIRALNSPGELKQVLIPIINGLRASKSPQFPIVMQVLISVLETGRVTANPGQMMMMAPLFSDASLPQPMRLRFFDLVMVRARAAAEKPSGDNAIIYQLLSFAIDDLGDVPPEMLGEAMALKTALSVSESKQAKARREAQERIDGSLDKLAATIEEAEKAEDASLKRSLFMRAEIMAKDQAKFDTAIDIVGRLKEVDRSELMKSWPDQEYADISRRALDKKDPQAGIKAVNYIQDRIRQANAWRSVSMYFFGVTDKASAAEYSARSLKMLIDADSEDPQRIFALIGALGMVEKSDPSSFPLAVSVTAKAVNDLPTPSAEDSPGTLKYAEYVRTILTINMSLGTIASTLYKNNPQNGTDLVERIQKKESRILCDFMIGAADIDLRAASKILSKPALKNPNVN